MCSRVHVWALLSSLPQIKLSQDLAFQPRTLPLFLLENTNSLKRPFTLQWVRRQGETMLAAENTTVLDLARALGTTSLVSLHHSAQAQISIRHTINILSYVTHCSPFESLGLISIFLFSS